MFNGGIGSASSTREFASFDYGSSSLLDNWNEFIIDPALIYHVMETFSINSGSSDVRVHCGRMVSPDCEIFNLVHVNIGFLTNLMDSSVMI